jgi:hypothetical protein
MHHTGPLNERNAPRAYSETSPRLKNSDVLHDHREALPSLRDLETCLGEWHL